MITPQCIWNVSSEICCWAKNGTCVTVIYISMQRMNGKCSRILQVEQSIGKKSISTGQVQDKLRTDNANIKRLIIVIGNQELSVKSMMDALDLKGRDNFQNLYLKPAISEGYVCLLYPNSPRHPRQKYLLTVKGLTVYKHCNKSK